MTPGSRAPHRRDLRPARVAMISMHTSPLDQPGTGDAGGMNVYIVELARRLAAAGTDVEIFTRSTSSQLPEVVEMSPGVLVRHIDAGPYQGLSKDELPAQLCEFSRGVLRAEAAAPPGWYDLVHSHYWLSGQVGALAAERWGVPLVHSMHTMAKVKNASLAAGDSPEPRTRVIGEQQVVDAADRLVANTDDEARELHDLYGAALGEVSVVSPGVDLDLFSPGEQSRRPRTAGASAGRAGAAVRRTHPAAQVTRPAAARRGPAGRAAARDSCAARGGRRRRPERQRAGAPRCAQRPRPRARHRRHRPLRAAGVATRPGRLVPSRHAGVRPVPQRVVRAGGCRGAGLRDACGRGERGRVAHGGGRWLLGTAGRLARPRRVGGIALGRLLAAPAEIERLGQGARLHARRFGWDATAQGTLDCYVDARAARERQLFSSLTVAQ